ncbi:MAG TPA: toprim domain-containing protein [Clostridiaceae bacterium]|nr:toprim domain-containing protein [Clostridiaceae bacterium]
MYLDTVKEKIRERVDPVYLLEWLGVTDYRVGHNMIRCACPIHRGRGKNNFSFDTSTGIWTCFSRRCGEDVGLPRDIFLLVMLVKGVSFSTALAILKSQVGLSDEECQFDKKDHDHVKIRKWLRKQRLLDEPDVAVIDESTLDHLDSRPHQYLLNRGFSPEIIKLFDVRYASSGDMQGRIVIPVRDDCGQLVGLSGRLITDDQAQMKKLGKWKHMFNFSAGSVLFGLDKAKPYVATSGRMVLVEGPFDVMKAFQHGLCNVCATLGVNILPNQVDLVIQNTSEVYLAYDTDEAGQKGARRIYEKLAGFTDVRFMMLPDGRDVADTDEYEIWDIYSNPLTPLEYKIKRGEIKS